MMKMKTTLRFLFLAASMLTVVGLKAQSTGIQFFHGTFAEAQTKAKKESKLIFMDAYTSWCAPCRMMAANVFTDQSVGEYFNEHFVNIKVDMEKSEGPSLSELYKVSAYPTLLFIDGNGTVKSRAIGMKSASDLIALGQKAVKL